MKIFQPTTGGGGGTGTVTSVGLTMPTDVFNVANSPITTSGTLAVTFDNQNANLVFAGPATGAAAAPTFRALVTADLPAITIAEPATEVVFGTGTGITTDANFTFDPVGDFNVLATNNAIMQASNGITIQTMMGGSAGDIFINNATFGNRIVLSGDGTISMTSAAGSPLTMVGDGGVSLLSDTNDVTLGSNGLTGKVKIGNASVTPTSALQFTNFDSATTTGTGAPIGVDSSGNVVTLDPATFPSSLTPGNNIDITANVISAIPTAPDRSIQWNNNGVFGGTDLLIFDGNNNVLLGGVDVQGTGAFGVGFGTTAAGGTIHVGTSSLGFGTSSDFGDIDATDEASLAFGLAESGGLINSGLAGMAFGHSQDAGSQISAEEATFVFGSVSLQGSIAAGAVGGLAAGNATNGSGNATTSGIQSNGEGSITMGSSNGSDGLVSPTYSFIHSDGNGAQAFGEVSEGSRIISSGSGSYASGRSAGNNGDGITSIISATSNGAQSRGTADSAGQMIASSDGATVTGTVTNGGLLYAQGNGSITSGKADDQDSGLGVFSQMITDSHGAIVFGVADSGGQIHAGNFGASASGLASGTDSVSVRSKIEASGIGSAANGYSSGGGNIISSANGSVVFGRASINGSILVQSTASGSLAFGFADGVDSQITTSGSGTVGAGMAFGHVSDGGVLHATQASLVFGAANGTSSIIQTVDEAAFAGGEAQTAGGISANDGGAIAFGFSSNEAIIQALVQGSRAFGWASDTDSTITASGLGAMATGHTNGGLSITASGVGSFAGGDTQGLADIIASGVGSFAFGASANSRIESSGIGSFAFGDGALAEGAYSVAFGQQNQVEVGASNSYAIGVDNLIADGAGVTSSYAIGQGNRITPGAGTINNSMAIGHAVEVQASNVYAFGDTYTVVAPDSFNIGFGQLDFQLRLGEVTIRTLATGGASQVVANGSGTLSTHNLGWMSVFVDNNATLALTQVGVSYVFNGTTTTWTLPAVPVAGELIEIKSQGSGNITLNSNAGGNDIYSTAAVATITITPGQAIDLRSDGAFWNVR